MADSDSDSSTFSSPDISTSVLLGYASAEPTSDAFSQLGGQPSWLDPQTPPSATLAKCKVCNGVCSLLLQLNADLVERFPGHERRVYVFGCRRRTCRRKEGSVRALRGVRVAGESREEKEKVKGEVNGTKGKEEKQERRNLGETLFGATSPTPAQANPFAASPSAGRQNANPFAAAKPAETTATSDTQSSTTTDTDDLSQTFAQKARISSPPPPSSSNSQPPPTSEPWQDDPSPYPSYHLDADKEYLEAEPDAIPSNARLDNSSENGGSSAADEKAAFESSMDKTFQRFADRLAQNPEQVLRYEFGGQPLLYSKDDKAGKMLAVAEGKVQTPSSGSSRIPRCSNCGAARVFEMQLTPHAITELEVEDLSVEGMDWGTIIVGSCAESCQQKGKDAGKVGYVVEWVGVQWEEVTKK